MFVAYIHDTGRYGTIFASFINMETAKKTRAVASDLVFNDDGSINQSDEWLFDWEKQNETCYVRKCQKANLNVSNFNWLNRYENSNRFSLR